MSVCGIAPVRARLLEHSVAFQVTEADLAKQRKLFFKFFSIILSKRR